MQFVQGDLQSLDLLNYILGAEEIDTVMHFAAQVSCLQQAHESQASLLPIAVPYVTTHPLADTRRQLIWQQPSIHNEQYLR